MHAGLLTACGGKLLSGVSTSDCTCSGMTGADAKLVLHAGLTSQAKFRARYADHLASLPCKPINKSTLSWQVSMICSCTYRVRAALKPTQHQVHCAVHLSEMAVTWCAQLQSWRNVLSSCCPHVACSAHTLLISGFACSPFGSPAVSSSKAGSSVKEAGSTCSKPVSAVACEQFTCNCLLLAEVPSTRLERCITCFTK